jgi:Protein of unknown function (DUF2905)
MGPLLIVVGLIIAGIGLVMVAGVPLGHLPGDIVIRRGNSTFYFPIVTCLVLSVLVTVLLSLFKR